MPNELTAEDQGTVMIAKHLIDHHPEIVIVHLLRHTVTIDQCHRCYALHLDEMENARDRN